MKANASVKEAAGPLVKWVANPTYMPHGAPLSLKDNDVGLDPAAIPGGAKRFP